MSRSDRETMGDILGMPVLIISLLFVVITVVCFVILDNCFLDNIVGKIVLSIMISLVSTFYLTIINHATL